MSPRPRTQMFLLVATPLLLLAILFTIFYLSAQTVVAQVNAAPLHDIPPVSGGGLPDASWLPPDGMRSVGNPTPRFGDQPLLVILVDFPDRAGLFTGQAWYDRFFGPGGFSEYYREVSYQQLRYTGDIVGMSGDTPVVNSSMVAYVRLPNPLTYYADGLYGVRVGPQNFPRNSGGVVYHALQALDASGFDFTPYADPATNQVENLVVVFAGSSYAYTRDPVNSFQATAYRLRWAGAEPYQSASGQIFDNYTFCPDQAGNLGGGLAFIGVCAHEQGHGLGMPDLYDYSYTTTGAGVYDIMAFGTYAFSGGQRPFQYSVFSKAFFGWVTPTVVPSGVVTVTLSPAETGANYLKLYPYGNRASQEYFLLENRQPLGFDRDWQMGGLCPGLLIWHIDERIVRDYLYAVNTAPSEFTAPHQGVIIVEADGRFDMIHPPLNYGECSDTWAPGQNWDDDSTPNARLWNGDKTGLAVTVLDQRDGQVTLRIAVQELPFRSLLPLVKN
jgi:immune inhibitor A